MKKDKLQIWFGKVPFWCWIPKITSFKGGYYQKTGFIWFNRMLEFSRVNTSVLTALQNKNKVLTNSKNLPNS